MLSQNESKLKKKKKKDLLSSRSTFFFFFVFDKTKVRTDHFTVYNAGRIRTHGIGGGHKQRYRMIDFQRLHFEDGKDSKPFEEKVVEVRYDPCR